MPKTPVVFYQEDPKSVPVLDWLDSLPQKALDKCRVRIERLRDLGYELRRPESDFLRDGIYELRIKLGTVNYRMLYFFHGSVAAVLAHGLVKESEVPKYDIELAIQRKRKFELDPERHTFKEQKSWQEQKDRKPQTRSIYFTVAITQANRTVSPIWKKHARRITSLVN